MLNRATAAWTLRVIRTAAPKLLAVLVALTLLQGLLPAALAMALRGLINAAAAGAAVDVSSQLLAWVRARRSWRSGSSKKDRSSDQACARISPVR